MKTLVVGNVQRIIKFLGDNYFKYANAFSSFMLIKYHLKIFQFRNAATNKVIIINIKL